MNTMIKHNLANFMITNAHIIHLRSHGQNALLKTKFKDTYLKYDYEFWLKNEKMEILSYHYFNLIKLTLSNHSLRTLLSPNSKMRLPWRSDQQFFGTMGKIVGFLLVYEHRHLFVQPYKTSMSSTAHTFREYRILCDFLYDKYD